MKEPDLANDVTESHLEIKTASMLTYLYGPRVGGMAGLPKRRQQRGEMDEIAEPNFVLR